MSSDAETGVGLSRLLSCLSEPRRYRDRHDQLLKTMDDPRCGCAPTCPFHRIPGEQWDLSCARPPWDES